MSIWDIINPWGALRRERRIFVATVADYENAHTRCEDAVRAAQQRGDALVAALQDADRAYIALNRRATNDRLALAETIAKGHFRNPKTGRIGRKGETFK